MDDRADARDYLFKQVMGPGEIEDLIATLQRSSADNERWEYDKWLLHSVENEKMVLEVRQEGDEEPAGFAIFSTQLAFEDHGMRSSRSYI